MNPRIDEISDEIRRHLPPTGAGSAGWELTIQQEDGCCRVLLYQPRTQTECVFVVGDWDDVRQTVAVGIAGLATKRGRRYPRVALDPPVEAAAEQWEAAKWN